MNGKTDCYGEWALISGAAEGLGAAFAKALAARKLNLIMVDHKEPVLNEPELQNPSSSCLFVFVRT